MSSQNRFTESLGARLHRLRTRRGLTQKALAGNKYTAAYISTVEADRRTPSTDALAYFAHQLGVSTGELSTGRPTELPADLLISLVEAELGDDEGEYRRARSRAAEHGLSRIEAAALVRLGELDAAEELLANEPITVRAPLFAARARVLEPRAAVILLESALAGLEAGGLPDPDAEAELRYALVHAYAELGVPERAAAEAEAAELLVGSSGEPAEMIDRYLRTARTLREQGRWADAESAAERALAACQLWSRRHAAAVGRWSRGRLLSRAGDYPAAVEALTAAHRFLGRRVAGELAEALWLAGQLPEALEMAEEAASATGYRIKGLISLEAGDVQVAERELRRALAVSEGLEVCTVARELGDLLRAAGREREAIEVYRAGLEAVERA